MNVCVGELVKDTANKLSVSGSVEVVIEEQQVQAQVEASLFNVGERIVVQGSLKAEVPSPCFRCLSSQVLFVESDFVQDYLPADSEELETSESLLESQDLFVYSAENKLDLTELVRQELLSNMPETALCDTDCLGLCSGCGVNLNKEECLCQEESVDPRLEVLRKFLPDA